MPIKCQVEDLWRSVTPANYLQGSGTAAQALIRKRIAKLQQRLFPIYSRRSFSQEGEDLILERFLEDRAKGFYVDIGAHHPKRFSNTYRLYRRGWSGLNIDAFPGCMSKFRRLRSRDTNVEAAVGADHRELTFYIFNEPALNTFEERLAIERIGGPYKIIERVKLTTEPLSELLDRYVPPQTDIDVLTVDVEGLDYQVLQSSDWTRYKPEFVLAECFGAGSIEAAGADPIALLLFSQGYQIVAKTVNTVIFRSMERCATRQG